MTASFSPVLFRCFYMSDRIACHWAIVMVIYACIVAIDSGLFYHLVDLLHEWLYSSFVLFPALSRHSVEEMRVKF
jgi:hypothetical protein